MQQRSVKANDVEFSYLESGPANGPLALCLHGFPDSAQTWRFMLPALGEAGYHAVAPWMRGYAPTQIPADGCYQTGALVTDAGALHEALGGDGNAVIIGHDWGAAAATGAAVHQPDRWRRVVTMAVPPLAVLASTFFTYAQLKRSFYIFVFQTPMAETAVSLHNHVFIDGLWADWSPGYDATWDVEQVKKAIGHPDNLTAAIGYYRAMLDSTRHDAKYGDTQAATAGVPPQPTLYLHGADDGCLTLDGIGDVLPFLFPGSVQVTVPQAGHFLQVEQPTAVNEHVLRFITAD